MSGLEAVETLLASTDLFGVLAPEVRLDCAGHFRELRFDKGRTLFVHGDLGTHAYVVAEGRVRMTLTTAAGRELAVRIAEPGSLVGEIAALDGGLRSADATAITPVLVLAIAAADLDRLIARHPDLARAAVRLLCARLRATTDQLEGIALHSIEVRLARFLLEALGGRTAPPGRRPAVELGYSQSDLARLIGSSRPKTNLALGALEAAGAIRRTADRIFCDPVLLAGIAGHDDG
ncbi:MAG: Crp/Fnr family transcriptional regulator [Siculibacillus sp.]|nr:Crp/Fnr family transcriptional regulator [Siculibacillus sp.]